MTTFIPDYPDGYPTQSEPTIIDTFKNTVVATSLISLGLASEDDALVEEGLNMLHIPNAKDFADSTQWGYAKSFITDKAADALRKIDNRFHTK
jgi:hypothetical protein